MSNLNRVPRYELSREEPGDTQETLIDSFDVHGAYTVTRRLGKPLFCSITNAITRRLAANTGLHMVWSQSLSEQCESSSLDE